MELDQWTRNTLTKEGLVVDKKRKKQIFSEMKLIQFNATLWTIDDAQFTHPRNKAQVPFAIVVFLWPEARIEAFSPDQENKNKGGLRYFVDFQETILRGSLVDCLPNTQVVLTRILSDEWKVIYWIDQH